MSTHPANAPKNQLVAFPSTEEITLTPALWLACGVVSYNFALLARRPMRILAAAELAGMPPHRAEAIARGVAVAADASSLTASIRSSMLQIARTLLAPLHFTVNLHGNQAAGRTQLYFLIEWHGGLHLQIPDTAAVDPDPQAASAPAPAA